MFEYWPYYAYASPFVVAAIVLLRAWLQPPQAENEDAPEDPVPVTERLHEKADRIMSRQVYASY